MSASTISALLRRQGEIQLEGFPKALDGGSGERVHGQLAGASGHAAWRLIGERGRQAAAGLLDIELKDVLAMAWNKYGVLAAAADASDDDTHQVALADHTISLTYRPTLEVTVDGVGRGTLEFSLTLEMTLKAIQLSIRGGRVVAVGSGTCEGNVKLELDDFTVLNRELPVVDLPGQLDLGNGIPITSSSHPEHVSKPVA